MTISAGPAQSIGDLLRDVARRHPHAAAIAAPGRTAVTYASLVGALDEVRAGLNRAGFGRGDRVALVVPDGPEMAVASVAVAASAVCVPLNPKSKAHEYDSYLADLKASVLVVEADLDSPARRAAQRQNIPVIDLVPGQDARGGLFTLTCQDGGAAITDGFAAPHETAFVVQTSGTTGRPKRIPLTHAKVWTRIRQRIATLELTEHDRCLNTLPLYYDLGLQMVLATLGSGGTVFCPPQVDADAFFVWLDEFRPTWYAAVPALQLAILSSAEHHGAALRRSALRFIRTGTAPLAPHALKEIERIFAAPVIQTYGITEVGTVCSSPMPPRLRKVGSVGVPAGPDVAIIDDEGAWLPRGAVGEVVVRGPMLFDGYEDDPAATAAAFSDGWFRTGDLGSLDADGFLFLKGRLKDLINRGGEKISPGEVEEALCAHPAVREAVVFPFPHPTLGEDAAAAVVLHADARATEQDLRKHAALLVADFKVPSRVVVAGEIPRGPTGKIRRGDLAQHFGPLLETPFVAPGAPLEESLARIWAEELGTDRVGVHDNFFELGGDSLKATEMCLRVEATTGRALSVVSVYKWPTVAQLARVLQRDEAPNGSRTSLVPLQADGTRPPLFCMHGAWGIASDYTPLALHLGPDQPVYGVQARGIDGIQPPHTRIEDMAAHYVQEIRAFFPRGPYLLCGYSYAGLLAWEVAQQLRAQGQRVALVALLDANLYANRALTPARVSAVESYRRRIQLHVDALRERAPHDRPGYVLNRLKARWRIGARAGLGAIPPQVEVGASKPPVPQALLQTLDEARKAYLPRPYPGPITLVLVHQPTADLRYDPRLPGRLAAGPVEIHTVPGTHGALIKEPRVRALAKVLRGCIDRAIEPRPRPRQTTPFSLR